MSGLPVSDESISTINPLPERDVDLPNGRLKEVLTNKRGDHRWHYGNHPFSEGDESDYLVLDDVDEEGFPSRMVVLQSKDQLEEDLRQVDESLYYLDAHNRQEVIQSAETNLFKFARRYLQVGLKDTGHFQHSSIAEPSRFLDLGINVNLVPYEFYPSLHRYDGQGYTDREFTTIEGSSGSPEMGTLDVSTRRNIIIKETPVSSDDIHLEEERVGIEPVKNAVGRYMEAVIVHEGLHKVCKADYKDIFLEEGFIEFCTSLSLPPLTPSQKEILIKLNESDMSYVENTTAVADLFIALAECGQFPLSDIFTYFYKQKAPTSMAIDNFIQHASNPDDARQMIERDITDQNTLSRIAESILATQDVNHELEKPLNEMSLEEKLEFIRGKYLVV